MMEEKTMDIKDIFARHGSRPCPLSIADANKLKGDSDELWDRVASQSGAVAGDDGGGSVLCMPLCAGQIQQNVDLISSGPKEAQNTVEDLPPPAAPEAIRPIPVRVLDPSKIKGD